MKRKRLKGLSFLTVAIVAVLAMCFLPITAWADNLTITDNGDGTYSFTMPDGDVTVKADVEKTALADGKYRQTADKDGKHYIRYVFVKPKSEIEGKSKAKFTATLEKDGGYIVKEFETSTYYTGMTSNGITYKPESSDSIMLVVTITGVSKDQENDLTCEVSILPED